MIITHLWTLPLLPRCCPLLALTRLLIVGRGGFRRVFIDKFLGRIVFCRCFKLVDGGISFVDQGVKVCLGMGGSIVIIQCEQFANAI